MSKANIEDQRKRRYRSLDTIVVYNPTSEDFVFWDDKFGPTRQRILVPKAQKDIGHGKGMSHILRYLAKRYAQNMVVQQITKISDADWAEKKKQYRTRDEMLQHQAVEPIRTNDMNYWYQYIPHKNNLDRSVTRETTLIEVMDLEIAFRKKNNIAIPVKTLVWLGVIERYGGDELPEVPEDIELDTANPFRE